eukprot:scaffold105_cov359-Prasinococcus_capsulatus_cf.AAC.3
MERRRLGSSQPASWNMRGRRTSDGPMMLLYTRTKLPAELILFWPKPSALLSSTAPPAGCSLGAVSSKDCPPPPAGCVGSSPEGSMVAPKSSPAESCRGMRVLGPQQAALSRPPAPDLDCGTQWSRCRSICGRVAPRGWARKAIDDDDDGGGACARSRSPGLPAAGSSACCWQCRGSSSSGSSSGGGGWPALTADMRRSAGMCADSPTARPPAPPPRAAAPMDRVVWVLGRALRTLGAATNVPGVRPHKRLRFTSEGTVVLCARPCPPRTGSPHTNELPVSDLE